MIGFCGSFCLVKKLNMPCVCWVLGAQGAGVLVTVVNFYRVCYRDGNAVFCEVFFQFWGVPDWGLG